MVDLSIAVNTRKITIFIFTGKITMFKRLPEDKRSGTPESEGPHSPTGAACAGANCPAAWPEVREPMQRKRHGFGVGYHVLLRFYGTYIDLYGTISG